MRTKLISIVTAVCALVATAQSLSAGNWPQWRGPNFNGSADEKGLPESFAKEAPFWKAPMPGQAGSTPIVWDEHVFLTSPDNEKNLNLIALNRKDGSVRWKHVVGIGDRSSGRNNMSSPSPVTDGKIVVALFATSDIAAYDFDGKEIWKRNLGKDYGRFSLMWIYGSSPLLFENNLYVQVLQRDPPDDYAHARDDKPKRESYLLCLDPQTGKTKWQHVRPSDAIKESQEAYSTPIPFKGPNGWEIIILGGDYTTGHDPGTGKELWRAGALNPKKDLWWRIVPSPVTSEDMIFASAPKRDPVFALKAGGKGDITETHVAWTYKENPTDWATPLYYKGRLFVLDGDRKVLTCLNPKDGSKIWQGRIDAVKGPIWSSPTGADDKIYVIGEDGTAVVLSAGDEFKVLSTVPMGEQPIRSSIAAAQGQIFVRTAEHLYCFGKK